MTQRLFGILLLCVFLSMLGAPALGHDYDRDDSDHPLRYAAYVVHPAGILVEYAVLRPIHWVVSRPHLRVIFGHDPRPEDKHFEWKAGVNDDAWKEAKSGKAVRHAEREKMMHAHTKSMTQSEKAMAKSKKAMRKSARTSPPALDDGTYVCPECGKTYCR